MRFLDAIPWPVYLIHLTLTLKISLLQATGEAWFGLSDNYKRDFGAVFSGSVLVQKGGEWEFTIVSSDDAAMMVDGRPLLVAPRGAHKSGVSRTRSAKMTLGSGYHGLKVAYVAAQGGAPQLQLLYKGPDDTEMQVIGQG